MERDRLINARRMVVKFGTGILTNRSKQIDPGQIEQLVAQVAAQRQAGREVVVVTDYHYLDALVPGVCIQDLDVAWLHRIQHGDGLPSGDPAGH